MAHPSYLRTKARAMRAERRLTIDEIAERLLLPRSTVYSWVRDLPGDPPPDNRRRQAARRKGNLAMQRKYRLLRESAYDDGFAAFDSLASDTTFRDFVCLYLAEGYKRSRNVVSVCNSDPGVMTLSVNWLRRLTPKQIQLSIQVHADQDLDALRGFWADTLGVEQSDISLQRKSNSGQLRGRNWRSRYGVLTARVCDTLLRARLDAWICRLRESWQVNSPRAGRGAAW